MYWNLYSYLHLSQVIIFIFLFFLVFLQKSRTNLLKILFIILFNIFAWKTANLFSFSHDKTISVLAAKTSLIFAYFIPAFFYLFVDVFLNPQKKLIIKNILLIFLPTLLFIPFSFGELNISSIYFDGRWKTVDGPIYAPFILYFMLYFGGILGRLINKYFDSTTHYIQKQQIFYIVIGTFLSTSIGIITQGILPLILKNNTDYPLRSLAPLPFGLFLTFAILRYRFIGMKVVIRKSLITFSLVTIILALTATLLLLFERFFQSFFTMSEKTSFAVTVVLISFSFPLLHHFVSRIIHRWLDDDVIDFGEVVDLDSKSWLKKSELQQYVFALSKELEQKLYVPSVILLVADPDFQTYASVYPKQFTVRFKFEHPLMRFIKDLDRVFEIEKLKKFISTKPVNECQHLQRFYSLLSKHRTALVAPIESQGDMLGIAFIPKKIDNSPFSDADFSYLILLFDEVYSALHSLLKGKDDAQSQFIFPDKGNDTIH